MVRVGKKVSRRRTPACILTRRPCTETSGPVWCSRVRGQLTLADVGVPQVSVRVLVVEGRALLALSADGVVLTVLAHAAAHVARRHVHGQVEVARRGVLVALALWERGNMCIKSAVFRSEDGQNARRTERKVRIILPETLKCSVQKVMRAKDV